MKYHYSGRDFTHRMNWGRQTLTFTGRVLGSFGFPSLIRFEK